MSLRLPLVFWNSPPKLHVTSCVFTRDLRRAITGSKGGLCMMWNLDWRFGEVDGQSSTSVAIEPFALLYGHEAGVAAICECTFDHTPSICTVSQDGSVFVWDASDGRCMAVSPYLLCGTPNAIALLDNGSKVACAGQHSAIEIVDLQSMRVIYVLDAEQAWVTKLASGTFMSPDGPQSYVAAVCEDSVLRAWILQGSEGEHIAQLAATASVPPPVHLAVSGDCSAVLVVSQDQWMLFSAKSLRLLCTVQAPEGQTLAGGSFIMGNRVAVWTSDFRATIYECPDYKLSVPGQQPRKSKSMHNIAFAASVVDNQQENGTIRSSQSIGDLTKEDEKQSQKKGNGAAVAAASGGGGVSKAFTSIFGAFGLSKKQQQQQPDSTTVFKDRKGSAAAASGIHKTKSAPGPLHSDAMSLDEDSEGQEDMHPSQLHHFGFAHEDVLDHSVFNEPVVARQVALLGSVPETAQYSPNVTSFDVPVWASVEDFLLCADGEGNLNLWQVDSGVAPGQSPELNCLAAASIAEGWTGTEQQQPSTPSNRSVTTTTIVEPKRVTVSEVWFTSRGFPRLIKGFEDGRVEISTLPNDGNPLVLKGHRSKVTSLLIFQDEDRNGQIDLEDDEENPYLASASSDCTVRIWHLMTGKLLQVFSLHSAPISQLFPPPKSFRKYFQNKCFCSVGEDRSVVMYNLRNMECMRVFGGHASPVTAVYWRQDLDYLLVRCMDGSVYAWELSTGLLDRRVYGNNAADLLERSESGSSRMLHLRAGFQGRSTYRSSEHGPIEIVNVNALDDDCVVQVALFSVRKIIPMISENRQAISDKELLPELSASLACVLGGSSQKGIHTALAQLLQKFGVLNPQTNASVAIKGASNTFSLLVPRAASKRTPYAVSAVLTAVHTMCCAAVLNALKEFPDLRPLCEQGLLYYLKEIPTTTRGYEEPSFMWCSQFLRENTEFVQPTARAIMQSILQRLNRDQLKNMADTLYVALCEAEGSTNSRRQNLVVSLAEFACQAQGILDQKGMAAVVQGLLEVVENGGPHHVTAITLLGTGCQIWKPYISDYPALIKLLFNLSIPALIDNVGSRGSLHDYALQALSSFGVTEPSIFVSIMAETISNNISNANILGAAISSFSFLMKRSAPRMLLALTEVAATIIKVLDPHVPALRDASIEPSTAVLRDMVKTYPMVSFHQDRQKLAVGNTEGLVTIFDLRTAAKWQLIEAHSGPVCAVSISPNGDQVASYAAKDSSVRVWPVDSTGVFNLLGALSKSARQYPVPDVKPMSASAVIQFVRLEWDSPGQLSVVPGKDSPKVIITLHK